MDPGPSTEQAQDHAGGDAGTEVEWPSPVPTRGVLVPAGWSPAQPHLQAVLTRAELAVGPWGTAAVLHRLELPCEGDAAAPQGLGDTGALHLGVHFAGLPEPVLRVTPAHRPASQRPQRGWACECSQGRRGCRARQGHARHSPVA